MGQPLCHSGRAPASQQRGRGFDSRPPSAGLLWSSILSDVSLNRSLKELQYQSPILVAATKLIKEMMVWGQGQSPHASQPVVPFMIQIGVASILGLTMDNN